MSGDSTGYEYPDEAGYPDGMGTLHEGTSDTEERIRTAEGAGDVGDADADADEPELEHFAMEDEEDDDEGV
ncbi:hypothetical protein [Agromyces sp. NPDC049794]|uniref:hypothetical protein n=1 Tax=unclassified Agromyces TaxID=2639701 RepID=UPI0033F5C2B5